MTNNPIDDEFKKWESDFRNYLSDELDAMEKSRSEGHPVNAEYYNTFKTLSILSSEELKSNFNHFKSMTNSALTPELFIESAQTIGIATVTKEGIDHMFNSLKDTYITYYKIDPNDPGMLFIIKQIVENELQINSFRQKLSEVDTRPIEEAKAAEQKRKITDSINKLTKVIFELTKYLQQAKEEAELKEIQKQEKDDVHKKRGLDITKLHDRLKNDPRIKKAFDVQRRKAKEYVKENLDEPE